MLDIALLVVSLIQEKEECLSKLPEIEAVEEIKHRGVSKELALFTLFELEKDVKYRIYIDNIVKYVYSKDNPSKKYKEFCEDQYDKGIL